MMVEKLRAAEGLAKRAFERSRVAVHQGHGAADSNLPHSATDPGHAPASILAQASVDPRLAPATTDQDHAPSTADTEQPPSATGLDDAAASISPGSSSRPELSRRGRFFERAVRAVRIRRRGSTTCLSCAVLTVWHQASLEHGIADSHE